MGAGKYRDWAVFERRTPGPLDAYRNPSQAAWSEVLAGFASLRETPGKEALAAGRLEATVTATLRINASQESPVRTVVSEDRVTVRGHVWDIVSPGIDPDGMGRQVEFTIKRGGAGT